MSLGERQLQELFQEMVEPPCEPQDGEIDAGMAGAEGLEEMLLLAQELRALGRETMPDAQASLDRARERVLQSLPAPLPRPAPQPRPVDAPPFWRRGRRALAPAMAWAPTALVLALTAVIFLAVTVSVSARAMPGSLLYPIKLTTENLTLRIVPKHQRGIIEDAINYHRAEEIQYAQERNIIVQAPYEGVVQGCEGNVCRIGAFTVKMPPAVAAQLQPGDRVRVVIQVQPGEDLVALSIAPGRTPTPTPAMLAATAKPAGDIRSLPTDTPAVVKVKPTRKPAPRPTHPPPAIRKGAATKAVPPKPTRRAASPTAALSRPGKASTATLAPLPLPQATATPARPPRATPTPAPTRPPRSTPRATVKPKKPGIGTSTPVPRGGRVTPGAKRDRNKIHSRKVIRGRINRVYRARGRIVWILVGRTRIYLTRETTIVGKITVGRQATARTYVRNGRRYASKITVKAPSSGSAPQPTPTPERSGTKPPVRRP